MEIDDYQNYALRTAIYPGRGTSIGLTYVALKLNGEAGEVAEIVGKSMRDDNSTMTDERREKLIKELGDVLWYIAAAASELDVDLSAVAYQNVEKLRSRQERGTLHGSGSNR